MKRETVDLYQVIEDYGIEFYSYHLPLTKSVSVKLGTTYAIGIDERRMEDSAEERTHLAHEIGHCVTDSFYTPYEVQDRRGKREFKADTWAVHTLIPWRALKKALLHGVTERWELAELFGVTEELIDRAWYIYQCEGKRVEAIV